MHRPTESDLRGTGLSPDASRALFPEVNEALSLPLAGARWRALRGLLRPDHPFELHLLLFRAAWSDHPADGGPPIAWDPTREEVAASNLGPLLADASIETLHRSSVEDPEGWWRALLEQLGVVFDVAPERLLEGRGEAARWLPGARLNIAQSCWAGRDPAATALVWQRDGGPLQRIDLGELRRRSERVAGALRAAGFRPGDAVGACMPMNAWSVPIYLGTVLAGCQLVSIADSFAPPEIALRLRISGARGIFTQDVIRRPGRTLPLYERVVESGAPTTIVLPEGDERCALRDGDLAWQDFLDGAPDAPFEPYVAAVDEVTNVLFSSGTTGEPKAIPWTHVTPIKAAADGRLHQDVRRGDVVAWPTNLGWMMGPWLIYASLLNGAAIALFEGVPTGRSFCRFVQDAQVTMCGLVPSLVRAWRAEGAAEGLDWSAVRCFSSTGEASGFEDYLWLMSRAPGYRPVVEYCGGTELGGGYLAGSVVQPQSPATFSTPAFGCEFLLLDDEGRPSELGELALVPPMLGSSDRLLNRDHNEVYFAGMPPGPDGQQLRRHGDQVERLPGGWYRAHGRVDDTMNLGGIKTSSAEIERTAATVPGVEEMAAVAVPPPGGGPSRLVLFAVLGPEAPAPAELTKLAQRAIRSGLNPLFKVWDVVVVDALPRTASGKVMRRVLRGRYSGGL